eukprot:TRINITY_DN93333_c0_g1_i1.p1 TRINITY_DN93333_c0_g1~~TRINITY_DN93333_c0_g1_i1.p1  ORF type:complete len:134 (+),score=18.34 TRINITY_DN93333_c0_g1_i1:59-403(+)
MAMLKRCRIQGSGAHGVLVEGCCRGSGEAAGILPRLLHCTVSDSRHCGIDLDAPLELQGCLVERSGTHGVRLAAGLGMTEHDVLAANTVRESGLRQSFGCNVYEDQEPCGDLWE